MCLKSGMMKLSCTVCSTNFQGQMNFCSCRRMNVFVPKVQSIFKTYHITGDYHGDIKFGNYTLFLTEEFLPNLPPCSVNIIANAYQNIQTSKPPSSNSSKSVMKNCLTNTEILFHKDMLKTKLYDLIRVCDNSDNVCDSQVQHI